MKRVATCGCGDVRITVNGDPQDCWVCHCDYCQRATGSIGQLAAVYAAPDLLTSVARSKVRSDFVHKLAKFIADRSEFFCNSALPVLVAAWSREYAGNV